MAPPLRRSTMNKKAQLGVFAVYVIAGIGALIGAVLLLVSLWRPGTFSELRGVATDAAAPVGEVGARARTGSQSVLEAISGFYRAGSRNAALQREVKLARVKLAEAEALKRENQRLKAVMGLATRGQEPVAVARLIGSTSASARRFAYISAGSRDGVRPGMPVTSPMGLVGRVLEAGSRSSRVLLLTDTESMVPVRRAQGDAVAFAEGRADGSLRLRLINLGINPIEPGDVFVTSGAGGIFQPGIAVAVATEITRDGAIAQLLSNPAATDFVMVEPIWQQEAVQSLNAPVRVSTEVVGADISAEAPVAAATEAAAPVQGGELGSAQTAAEDE